MEMLLKDGSVVPILENGPDGGPTVDRAINLMDVLILH
jgi:hypothetical protein